MCSKGSEKEIELLKRSEQMKKFPELSKRAERKLQKILKKQDKNK